MIKWHRAIEIDRDIIRRNIPLRTSILIIPCVDDLNPPSIDARESVLFSLS